MCAPHAIDANTFYTFLKKNQKKPRDLQSHHSTIVNQYDNVSLLLIVYVTIYFPAKCLPNRLLHCSAITKVRFLKFQFTPKGELTACIGYDSAICLVFSSFAFLTTTSGSCILNPDGSKSSLLNDFLNVMTTSSFLIILPDEGTHDLQCATVQLTSFEVCFNVSITRAWCQMSLSKYVMIFLL